jgi:hypothetical protein
MAAGIAVLLATAARAQVSITAGNLTYSQNFDSLTRSSTLEAWTDNTATTSTADSPRVVGLAGWYAAAFASASAGTTNGYTPQIRAAGTTTSATGAFYSYGATGDSDRALGTLPTDGITGAGAGALRFGVRFVNNTAQTITGFTFSYDGEQWRNAAVTDVNNQFTVGYALFAPGAGTLANPYIATAADFNTPFDGTGTGGTSVALDGNAPANRVAGIGDTITGISLAPGDELWLRWSDANSSGLDQGIGIDNFSITFAVPEPSSAAVLALGALVLLRRGRRK